MAFESRPLVLNIEDLGGGRVKLVAGFCPGRTDIDDMVAQHELACGRNTDPSVIRGSAPLGGLEDLRIALREMERQVSNRIKADGGKEAK